MEPLIIFAIWDPEAEVWVAEGKGFPLITEAPSLDALVAKIPGIIQDLRESAELVPFQLVARVHVSMQRIPDPPTVNPRHPPFDLT